MPKHNQFIKKLKGQFVSINDTLERYFNSIKVFKSKFKISKLSQNNKAFLIFGTLVIVILFYFLIPTFYNKDLIQSKIKNQILKKYNIDLEFEDKIKYGLLPKPHFVSKNASILIKDRTIGFTKDLKIFIAMNQFFSSKNLEVKDLIFQKTDFNIFMEDFIFFEELLKTEPSENKIIIKNSNIFFKNDDDEILFINRIKKSEFYYDSYNLKNILSSKNEIFNIPYKLIIKNDKFNKKIFSSFNSKKIRLKLENNIAYDDPIKEGELDIQFVNKSTSLEYELKKESLNFLEKNQTNIYDGYIEFKPFYFEANFNHDGLSTKNFFHENSIFFDLIKAEILNNKNLNINMNLNLKNIINIEELNNLFLKLTIESGNINFSNSNFMWKDDLKIFLNDSLLNYDENEIYLTGKIILDIKDLDDFYRSFQINKKNRKKIKEIQFDFNYNFTQDKITFDNFNINKKANRKIDQFIEKFNLNSKMFNKITFKNFVNDFFKVYSG